MKRVLTKICAIAIPVVLLVSCGGIKSDAKKVAALKCEAKEALSSVSLDDMSALKKSKELADEAAELMKEMKAKYSSDTEWKEYKAALEIALDDCK